MDCCGWTSEGSVMLYKEFGDLAPCCAGKVIVACVKKPPRTIEVHGSLFIHSWMHHGEELQMCTPHNFFVLHE